MYTRIKSAAYRRVISIFFITLLPILTFSQSAHTMKKDHHPAYAPVEIDPARVQLLGITSEKVIFRPLQKTIRTVGTVEVDETHIAHVQTKFTGWIEELFVNYICMQVKKNQPLFTVYSQELLATQEEYLVALRDTKRRMEGSFAGEYKQASANLLQATRQRLLLWDISPDQICALEKTKTPMRTLTYCSPSDGIVLDKMAFIGMNVGPGMRMYSVADLSHVWVLADIYEQDIDLVKCGQKGALTFSSFPAQTVSGPITFIDYVVRSSTRTAKVRFELDNKNFLLKPGMFATATIEVPLGVLLALPEEAVIDTGTRKLVFVPTGEGRFEPRDVQLGLKAGAYYHVLAGVNEGDEVITSAQFLLDSESRLKALGVAMKGHGVGH